MYRAQNLIDVPVARKIVLEELAKQWAILKRLGDVFSMKQIHYAGRNIFGKKEWTMSLLEKGKK